MEEDSVSNAQRVLRGCVLSRAPQCLNPKSIVSNGQAVVWKPGVVSRALCRDLHVYDAGAVDPLLFDGTPLPATAVYSGRSYTSAAVDLCVHFQTNVSYTKQLVLLRKLVLLTFLPLVWRILLAVYKLVKEALVIFEDNSRAFELVRVFPPDRPSHTSEVHVGFAPSSLSLSPPPSPPPTPPLCPQPRDWKNLKRGQISETISYPQFIRGAPQVANPGTGLHILGLHQRCTLFYDHPLA